MKYDEHIAFLENIHPNLGTTSIRTQPLRFDNQCSYDLDMIIPAYNVENYIDACIQSLLHQKTKYSYRVIIIDDGSTDQTPDLIDAYASQQNITVVHQPNNGASRARNTGLDLMQAKYVMFIDSDDVLPSRAVDLLVGTAEEHHADIVAGSYWNFRKFTWMHKSYPQKPGIGLSELEITGHPCCKVYRRELFSDIQFPEKYWFEDSVMHQRVFPKAQLIAGINDCIYYRRVNKKSITHSTAGNPKSLDSLWVTLRLIEDRKLLGIEPTQNYYDYLLDQTLLTLRRVAQLGEDVQKSTFYVMSTIINERCTDFRTTWASRKELEQFIRHQDFEGFREFINRK